MSLSVQAANINDFNVQIKNKNCVVITGEVNDLLEVNNVIDDIRNEVYNGSLGNCQIITFPNCNKPEINEPETSNPETNKPETNQPETSKPETNKPETNEPETSKPGTNKPEVNQPETNKPETSKPETDKEDKSFAEQVVDLVNAERAKAGLSPLTLDKEISSAALIRTKEIEKSFSHTRPDGRKFSTVLTDNGIRFRGAG
ncbi:MAG: transporter, partial [Lachnospiraceae bacterium]|nr:transporter [Lachnospiraceae bacterium]